MSCEIKMAAAAGTEIPLPFHFNKLRLNYLANS